MAWKHITGRLPDREAELPRGWFPSGSLGTGEQRRNRLILLIYACSPKKRAAVNSWAPQMSFPRGNRPIHRSFSLHDAGFDHAVVDFGVRFERTILFV